MDGRFEQGAQDAGGGGVNNDLTIDEWEIVWREEAMRQRERIRRTDEADGYFKQEEEENERR
jgi:hypothetical protein